MSKKLFEEQCCITMEIYFRIQSIITLLHFVVGKALALIYGTEACLWEPDFKCMHSLRTYLCNMDECMYMRMYFVEGASFKQFGCSRL